MENENPKADRYAGDAAWSAWFDLCSVARCGADDAAPLTEQIRTAMFAQLARSGYAAGTVGEDDPVTFFDAYFMAAGTRDRDKPLKNYFRHRMSAERRPLREFVCGTLFSARFGRIHDIVRDWIASVKGWKPHSLVGPDGKRHVVWESAAAKDFNDDKKDAGEMGAGHTMTALYELVPAGVTNAVAKTDPLKYQKAMPVASKELLTVKLRYKTPDGDTSKLVETPVVAKAITRKDAPSEDLRFAASVAEFALVLKDSKFKGNASMSNVVKRAKSAKGKDENGYRAEFIRLAETAELLKNASPRPAKAKPDTVEVDVDI